MEYTYAKAFQSSSSIPLSRSASTFNGLFFVPFIILLKCIQLYSCNPANKPINQKMVDKINSLVFFYPLAV